MKRLSTALFTAMALTGLAAQANAQELMGDRPWDFNNQTSRASIASMIYQAEQGSAGAAAFAGAGQACGGGGTATATGNYTCIIMNKSSAAIEALQDSTGNQSSTSDSDVAVNGTDGESMGDILESLTN